MEISSLSPSALSHLAINAALESKWDEALEINKHIIKQDPENIDALNRLGRAYFEIGKIDQAKKYYKLALKVDTYNPIAQKNLKLIENYKNVDQPINHKPNGALENGYQKISPSLFLQEPGKTKIVNLLKVAEPQKLSMSYPGMAVEILVKNRKIIITDRNGVYLGILPDDLSYRLFRLIKGGNKYIAFVKSVKVNALAILIREVSRSKRLNNQPSFLEQHSTLTNNAIFTALTNDDANASDGESDNEPEEFN